jgi:hypothetical protein
MEKFLNQKSEDNIVTPENLAWILLLNDDVENYAGIMQSFVDNSVLDPEKRNKYEDLAGQFEVLITIYMEMVFGLLKINHVNSMLNTNGELDDEDEDPESTFNPDLSKLTLEDLKLVAYEKFKKIRTYLSVTQIIETDLQNTKDFGYDSQYYCRILLKDLPEGKMYFNKNQDRLDPDKRYTFVIRMDDKKNYKKLEDFYAVCALPNMKVRISFSPINVIVKNK